jgi:hypothetical protein
MPLTLLVAARVDYSPVRMGAEIVLLLVEVGRLAAEGVA